MALRVGSLIADRFEITGRLARGGMAEIWDALDRATNMPVAIKTPRVLRPDAIALFRREARLLERIRSPYVAAYLGYVTDPDGAPCLVVERLVGETLSVRLKRVRALTVADLAPIVEQVLMGLCDAHAANVVHRDLTPDNVFLTRTDGGEIAKLLDFGVGKPVDDSSGGFSSKNATLGSLPYMAPEQWIDPSSVDARTDLYALGTIAFQCLTGRLPFPEKTAVRLIALKGEFAAPTLAEASIVPYPSEISAFIARALERDREARFPSADAMLDEWRLVLAALPSGGHVPIIAVAQDMESDNTATMTHSPRRKR